MDATKRQLRVRLWFPGMDKVAERRVSTCLPCQASVESKAMDPLKPTKAPEEPWSRLYADHWGPTKDGHHILDIVDGLARYPEVAVVKGTSAEHNIQGFFKVFSRHGIPRRLYTNNSAPFIGKDSHILQKYLTNMGIKHVTNKSTEDPEATGLVEPFMHRLKKIFHTAGVEREDPYLRLNNYLMQFRATPHATMRKCLAEFLFGRKFMTKLPDMRTNLAKDRKDIMEAKEEDKLANKKMTKYKDNSGHVKAHDIKVGDLVIAKRKLMKQDSVYDPKPYKVVATYGTQIKGMREDGKHKTKDSQR